MRTCIFLFLLILFKSDAYAQRKTFLHKKNPLATIAFEQLDGGVPLIICRLLGVDEELRLILDSGSGGVSLDSTFCANHRLVATSTDTIISGIGGTTSANYLFQKSLVVGTHQTLPMNFHVFDYAELSAVYGERIDGVLGFPFFSQYLIYLDNEYSKIELYPPQKVNYPKAGQLLHPKIVTLPLQKVKLRDKKNSQMNFFLDCGAGLPILFNENYIKDSALLRENKNYFATRAEGAGGSTQLRLTTVRSVVFGKYHFTEVPAYIFNDKKNVTAYPFSGGLVGNEILRRFNIIFNYANAEIHIAPNAHFQEAFDYGYSGLTLHQYDNKIIIEDVVPESPANKAGLMIGDELIGVDQHFKGNLKFFRGLLQQPDKNFKVFVKRKNTFLELPLTTVSIR